MTSQSRIAAVFTVVVGMALAGSARASAATSGTASAAVTPPGYTIVKSADITAPAGAQTFGSVSCPVVTGTQTYPISGGVRIQSSSILANIKSSYPNGTSWYGYANNASSAATTFEVYAVCIEKPTDYTVVHSKVTSSPADGWNARAAICPTGLTETGGGVSIASASTVVNMSSDSPNAKSWYGAVVNASSTAATFETWLICAKFDPKVKKHEVATPPPGPIGPPGTQTKVQATCPSGYSALGGGVDWDTQTGVSPDTVAVNTTYPGTGTWISWVNNGSTVDADLVGYVLCAL